MHIDYFVDPNLSESQIWELQNFFNLRLTYILPYKYLNSMVMDHVENKHKIMNDCMKIINNTTNPDIFFYRLKLLKEVLRELAFLYQFSIFKKQSPQFILTAIIHDHDLIVNGFINRYWDKVISKCSELKTQAAKQKRIDEFFDIIEKYKGQLSKSNIEKIISKKTDSSFAQFKDNHMKSLVGEGLKKVAESPELNAWADTIAKRMVTSTLDENSRTWRQAAAKSSEGQRMYNALQKEMQGTLGKRTREIITSSIQLLDIFNEQEIQRVAPYALIIAQSGSRNFDSSDDIIQNIMQRFSEDEQETIGQTLISISHAALTQARAEDTGHDWYIWHTSEDQHVRKSHKLMDKVLCRYSDAPAPEELAGEKSEGNYSPGNMYNCRCYAEPIIYWEYIEWPRKVYADGQITRMSKQTFTERFGVMK